MIQIAPPGRRCTVPLPRWREYSPEGAVDEDVAAAKLRFVASGEARSGG
jgi:hypothetical protein